MLCGENRSPSLGSRPSRSSEDSTRLEKGGTAGPVDRKMDRGTRCNPTKRRRRSPRRNIGPNWGCSRGKPAFWRRLSQA
ncbi:hypothetical protein NDU88_003313 [Pleurodeles waltl]|uniref:Uncharacterized protein n=1 Tax=Pleurodeles waltl TaxID=8319 RepID=A0AAV7RCS4_PLEWA|nr:hypothetical protein NDU88_003313 [Pleurodeles waltl]